MIILLLILLTLQFQEKQIQPEAPSRPDYGPCNNLGQSRPPFCDNEPDEIPISTLPAVIIFLGGTSYGIYKLRKKQ